MHTFNLPLSDLISRIRPVDSDSWQDLVAHFERSEFDQENIELLREDLRQQGSFNEPVHLSLSCNALFSGQHRVVASILEGAQTILCTEDQAPTNLKLQELKITLSLVGKDLNSESIFDMCSAFRTLRITDNFWAEFSVASRGNSLILYVSCPEHLTEKLIDKILQRIERVSFKVEDLKTEKIT